MANRLAAEKQYEILVKYPSAPDWAIEAVTRAWGKEVPVRPTQYYFIEALRTR